MPNGEDFGYDEYYKLWIEALKAAKRAGDITPEEYNQKAAYLFIAFVNLNYLPINFSSMINSNYADIFFCL